MLPKTSGATQRSVTAGDRFGAKKLMVVGAITPHHWDMAAATRVRIALTALLFTGSALGACGKPPVRPNAAIHAQRQADDAQLNSQRFGTTPFSSRDQLRHSVCWQSSLETPARNEVTLGCGPDVIARE